MGSFQIFSKIRRDIHKSRCTTGINVTSGKFATGVSDSGGKFSAGVNYAGGKFTTGINDTGGIFATGVKKTVSDCLHLTVNLRKKFIHM
jgi:hypothetical protein